MIIIGAKWCASCQVLKRDTIEPMKKTSELEDVVVCYVDQDERPELARELKRGDTLPQIVLFNRERSTKEWKRFSLTGMQNRSRIKELLQRAFH